MDGVFHLIPASVSRAGGRSTAPAVSTDSSSSPSSTSQQTPRKRVQKNPTAVGWILLARLCSLVVFFMRNFASGFAVTPGRWAELRDRQLRGRKEKICGLSSCFQPSVGTNERSSTPQKCRKQPPVAAGEAVLCGVFSISDGWWSLLVFAPTPDDAFGCLRCV